MKTILYFLMCSVPLNLFLSFRGYCQSLSWTQVGSGYVGPASLTIGPDGSLYAIGGAADSYFPVVYRTTNAGAQWDTLASIPDQQARNIYVSPSGILFSWANYFNRSVGSQTNLMRSSDTGTSWTNVLYLQGQFIYAMAASASGDVFVAADSGVYGTNDSGAHWRHLNNGYPSTPSTWSLSTGPNSLLLAGTYYLGIFRSTDNGESWQPANNGIVNATFMVNDIRRSPKGRVFAITCTSPGADNASIYISSDNGASWGLVTSNAPNIDHLYFGQDSVIYSYHYSTFESSFASTDAGKTWAQVTSGLTGIGYINSMALAGDGYLYAGGNGIFRTVQPVITEVANLIATDPANFTLWQNYPNPFNPTTRIRFRLPSEGRATLKVCNILGEEVATLLDNCMTPGEHSVTFSGNRLPSGIYFCWLRFGSNVQSRSLFLLK